MSDLADFLRFFVEPWYESLAQPRKAQEDVLRVLIRGYAKTEYGACRLRGGQDMEGFRSSFPVVSYRDLRPYLDEVMRGNYQSLLPEPVVRWVMTRGTTGKPKFVPTTKTHLSQIWSVGARAIVNFALRHREFDVLQGGSLNLNFPSEVGAFNFSGGVEPYGYSSGTYARLNPRLGPAELIPRQEEIDAIGGDMDKKDWEDRFELVYERARHSDIRSVMGVTPVIVAFARYLKRKHGVLPKQLWNLKGIFCTSVPKIHTNYAPLLRQMYGQSSIVEMYTATEGVFAQQLDDLPYVSPNYDNYLFEVMTGKGVKSLYELEAGEWGRLIVSSILFPRYDIGDMIEAMGKGYFRIFGRVRRLVILEHILFNIVAGRFR